MNCLRRLRKLLLPAATLLFLANSMLAYGACCPVPVADGDTGQQMPCGTLSDGGNPASQDEADCCLSCVAMLAVPDVSVAVDAEVPSPRVMPLDSLAPFGLDPPFRPPISTLS